MNIESTDSQKIVLTDQYGESDSDKFDVEEKSVLTVLGHILMSHRQFENAVSVYECIRNVDPKDKHALRALVYLYIEQSRYKDALSLLESYKKLEVDDNEVDHLCGLLESRALWESGREHDARICFREYLEKSSVVK